MKGALPFPLPFPLFGAFLLLLLPSSFLPANGLICLGIRRTKVFCLIPTRVRMQALTSAASAFSVPCYLSLRSKAIVHSSSRERNMITG